MIAMIKFGDRLGAFGKFVKRFVFNANEGEEEQLNMRYSFLLRRQQKARWDIAAANARVTELELGFHNSAYCFSQEQSRSLGQVNSDGSIYHGNRMIRMNEVSQTNNYDNINGQNSRTRSLKESGMMTKL